MESQAGDVGGTVGLAVGEVVVGECVVGANVVGNAVVGAADAAKLTKLKLFPISPFKHRNMDRAHFIMTETEKEHVQRHCIQLPGSSPRVSMSPYPS